MNTRDDATRKKSTATKDKNKAKVTTMVQQNKNATGTSKKENNTLKSVTTDTAKNAPSAKQGQHL